MLDEISARRVRPVIAGIASRRRAEQLLPVAAAMQLIGVLDDMAGFMPENSHALGPGAALDVDDLLFLQPHEARMRQIERNGDARRVVRAEPFAGDPGMGPHPDAPLFKLIVQIVETVFEPGALYRNLEVAKAKLKQLLVGQRGPGKFFTRHAAAI